MNILDLSITLSPPPLGAPKNAVATMMLRCDALGLAHEGGLLLHPLIPGELGELHWYLREYWQWPFAEFAVRGERVERELLPSVGKRLYAALCASIEATRIVEGWRLALVEAGGGRQISILSSVPEALSLPWELLHDEAGFLALRTSNPVSVLRRLPQSGVMAPSQPIELPLRVLLVTARPEESAAVDQRAVARPLMEELAPLIETGAVEVEMLRPPTLSELRKRLRRQEQPVHILHFDGHGVFKTRSSGQGEGFLEFENHLGRPHRVAASELAQVLQGSSVRLSVLTACESSIGSVDDVFSSVAARLVQGGIEAVVAMSAPILVVSAAIYVRAFYRALAAGDAVPLAHETARQTLHDAPERHLHRRRRDQEGKPVVLHDWWLPHFFAQRPTLLQSLKAPFQATSASPSESVVSEGGMPKAETTRLSGLPPTSFYSFAGRARELQRIERELIKSKLIVLSGFGGVGKTALGCEAAEWLTTTRMFKGACFISFEHGGDARRLLEIMGAHLGLSISGVNWKNTRSALSVLQATIAKSSLLLIVDNVETLLDRGSVPLDAASRTALWSVLRELAAISGCGVIVTTQNTVFGDAAMMPSRSVAHMMVQGLHPEDAFSLASQLLLDLDIDRSYIPFSELRDLLSQIDHHPLSIQLVLPTLRELSISQLRQEFAALLPRFQADAIPESDAPNGPSSDATALGAVSSERHASLLCSLHYSLRRLTDDQRLMLSRLTIFEGAASEPEFLSITRFSPGEWGALRASLEQAGLLSIEPIHSHVRASYLHFHPVLIPFLRSECQPPDATLREDYMEVYFRVAVYIQNEDSHNPIPARPLFWRHLPNLRKALQLFLDADRLDEAVEMGSHLSNVLDHIGSEREREGIRQQLRSARVEALRRARASGELRKIEWIIEDDQGTRESERGDVAASCARFEALLNRIEAEPIGAPVGPGSFSHCQTLHSLSRCYKRQHFFDRSQSRLEEELPLIEALIAQNPEDELYIRQRNVVLTDLGEVLVQRALYGEARIAFEEALKGFVPHNNVRDQAVVHIQLGRLERTVGNIAEASRQTVLALNIFEDLNEPRMIALSWADIGSIHQLQRSWNEAQCCFREALSMNEDCGYDVGAADACSALGGLALEKANSGFGGHFREEAANWFQREKEFRKRAQRHII